MLNLPQVLNEAAWQGRLRDHTARVGPWVEGFRERKGRHETHPVYDFLFTYYTTNRKHLEQWRPGWQCALQGEAAKTFLQEDNRYGACPEGICLLPERFNEAERKRLTWILQLLKAALNRAPRTNCFGLHEWAMVYRTEAVRHEKTPLRCSPAEVAAVVENGRIICSHYDAFRFFTPDATPLNTLQPERNNREEMEQFGCIHFNMDLFKLCYTMAPWTSSELTADCFFLALEARELDMRASPYDLQPFGLDPIPIETPEGRTEYQHLQRTIYQKGQPLARRLIAELEPLLA